MKKVFLCAAMAVLALVGCEKQTQTSLDFEDVQKEAKITGKLGFWYAEPGGKTEFVALKGQRIWFRVDANKYDGNVTAGESYKVFETVTSSVDSIAGNFEIVVPVGNKQINGDLMTDVIKINHNGKMFYFDALNGGAGENLDLLANDCKVKQVDVNKDNVLSECVGEGTVKGRFTRNAGTAKMGGNDESGEISAEGFTVVLHVKYDKKNTGDAALVKKYVTTTNASGEYSFSIPAYDDGNAAEIEVKQKAATYREFKNNKWDETEYFYAYAKTAIAKIQINEVVLVGTNALTKGAAVEKNTKKAFNKVSGVVKLTVEEMESDDKDHQKGPKVGESAYKDCEVTIELINTTEGKSLFYTATTDKTGKYEADGLQVYDDWDLADVTVKVYVNGVIPWIYEKGVCPGFTHYFLSYTTKADGGTDYYYKKIDKWYGKFEPQTSEQNQGEEQILNGTYNEKIVDGAGNKVWQSVSKPASMYFNHEMADLVLEFTPENEEIIKGIGKKIDKEDLINYSNRTSKTVTTETLYSDGIKGAMILKP